MILCKTFLPPDELTTVQSNAGRPSKRYPGGTPAVKIRLGNIYGDFVTFFRCCDLWKSLERTNRNNFEKFVPGNLEDEMEPEIEPFFEPIFKKVI